MTAEAYDPRARRDTPLALILKDRIRREGPIRVDQYMEACLHDASHGYYVNKAVLGAPGDFITAPEISQVFGELIGLWCVAVWQQMGEPPAFNLVEFGPGRGTLMRDALRAMRVRPKSLAAMRVVLLETSNPLKEAQRTLLAQSGVPVSWPGKLVTATEPNLPAIIIGNEFLDTEPIEQFVRLETGWGWRTIAIDAGEHLCFDTRPGCPSDIARGLDQRFPRARSGDICEVYSINHDVGAALLQLPVQTAAIFIDYGHPFSEPGDTLQAVRSHTFEHPLTSPGEADITAQVDFSQISDALRKPDIAIDGPITQAEFLGRLGIIERASKLMSANPAKAGAIETAIARLMAPTGMGSRFKLLGVRSAGLSVLPGFEANTQT